MKKHDMLSSSEELKMIAKVLSGYIKLPFSDDTIPGALMESVLAHVRKAKILKTYDFVDVVDTEKKIGWQVKATKASTPVTWKRAKIPNSPALIKASTESEEGLQTLGNAIIAFCNDHAKQSLETYGLNEIGFSRLLIEKKGKVTYFERLLCSKTSPKIFNENDFSWRWSSPKKTKKKEQLHALHGIHKETGSKWFAWHGLGENQLHFSGEHNWWPKNGDCHSIRFSFPTDKEKITLPQLMKLLASI